MKAVGLTTYGRPEVLHLVELPELHAGSGEVVLVTPSGGALGTYAVALAHDDGLRVIAVDSANDEQTLRALGAAEFVLRGDDAAEHVRRLAPEGVDAVIDAAILFEKIAPAIRDGGKLIDLRATDAQLDRGIQVIHENVRQRVTDHAAIVRLREQVESGLLPMRVAHTYPVSAVVEAHRRLDEGHLRGRIVLLFDAAGVGN